MTKNTTLLPVAGLALSLALGLSACGSNDTASSSSSTSSSVASSTTSPDAGATSAASTSSDASATSSQTASSAASAPAGMRTVTGTGYSLAVPAQWQKGGFPKKPSAQTTGDLNYGIPQGSKFMPSVNVQISDQAVGNLDLAEMRKEMVAAMVSSQGKEVLELEDTIDGEKAVGVAGLMTVNGIQMRMRQLDAVHNGKLYAISLLLPATSTNAEAKQQLKQITSTWKWNG